MSFQKSWRLPRSIKYFRSPLAVDDSRISKAILKQLNFKPVIKMSFRFNPLLQKTESIRQFCSIISDPKWRTSNTNLIIKINVLSDNSPPEIEVSYDNGRILILKTENLSLRETIEIIITHTGTIMAE
ncbi:putative mitochondrial ribosomal protein L53 [Schistosoma mansoni]|uniref:Large ribosomal subunit protein mL53 n=1 Tax=Schistosoma mansoni TaxID=6183 RepID=G4VMR4_SCHMA|nr:putative mitochondrial ribosomal protein L53 [Schistosoma mansoni]|eukprot:XP_018653550.1 putative mitochondrial ribosomal protein L53 [Schistosoma mansoni]